jgi:hypothetical protein
MPIRRYPRFRDSRKLDVVGVAINELKANPPLIIYANRVLSLSIARECFELVARRNPEVIQSRGKVDVFELSGRSPSNLRRNSFGFAGDIEFLRALVGERFDHSQL